MRARRGYRDRSHAGSVLALTLSQMALDAPVVLALPRGGVPVAAVIAERLGAPLDVLVVRKIGAPTNPEYALGAIGEGGVEVLDAAAMRRLGLDRSDLAAIIDRERRELRRRVTAYRRRPLRDLTGHTVVVVDDGVATGNTVTAALQVVRAAGAARVHLALPVGPRDIVDRLGRLADDVLCPLRPATFGAVGGWYADFRQVSDDVVRELLDAVA